MHLILGRRANTSRCEGSAMVSGADSDGESPRSEGAGADTDDGEEARNRDATASHLKKAARPGMQFPAHEYSCTLFRQGKCGSLSPNLFALSDCRVAQQLVRAPPVVRLPPLTGFFSNPLVCFGAHFPGFLPAPVLLATSSAGGGTRMKARMMVMAPARRWRDKG